jgi:hypothetical protein
MRHHCTSADAAPQAASDAPHLRLPFGARTRRLLVHHSTPAPLEGGSHAAAVAVHPLSDKVLSTLSLLAPGTLTLPVPAQPPVGVAGCLRFGRWECTRNFKLKPAGPEAGEGGGMLGRGEFRVGGEGAFGLSNQPSYLRYETQKSRPQSCCTTFLRGRHLQVNNSRLLAAIAAIQIAWIGSFEGLGLISGSITRPSVL